MPLGIQTRVGGDCGAQIFSYKLCGEVRLSSSAMDTRTPSPSRTKERADGAGRESAVSFLTAPDTQARAEPHHVTSYGQTTSWGH